ncbi:NADP-dependent oxidoreductase [Variovorax sp. GB1R11]|uniref:NADP-dependent oxidoreductase n=1 Tax=Variovorax sp. GB1R11 TaxID=3443741 RepID=UPI003F47C02E
MNRRIVLAAKPKGRLDAAHFRLEDAPMPEPAPGELLVRVRLLSIDAANRAWMQAATYRDELQAGTVMAGTGVGQVITSRAEGFEPGDLVTGGVGWQDHAVLPAAQVRLLPRREPVSHLLSVYGTSGLTACLGLEKVGQLQPGETVVVSAAAGSVGSLAGQIAKRMGARVVGIAGGRSKCDWLVDELGFDAAIDHRAGPLAPRLREAVPEGIDVYFDNVGGEVFGACLFAMNDFGRIVCCGAVSQYDGPTPPHGPRGVPGLIVLKRLRVQGFFLPDHESERDDALGRLEAWVRSGALRVPEDIVEGLENAPAALIGLLAGENRGKRLVRVAP